MLIRSQSGNSHIGLVIVIVVAILGGLGYVFWKNISSHKPDEVSVVVHEEKVEAPQKKSEVVELADSKFNKYVNYEHGFEFLFPKQFMANAGCKKSYTRYDMYGNQHKTPMYYMTQRGATAATVLEDDSRYMIASQKSVFLFNQEMIDGSPYAKSCDVRDTTADMVDEAMGNNGDVVIYNTARIFEVVEAKSKNEIIEWTKGRFADSRVTIKVGNEKDGRQDITVTPGRGGHMTFAYKLWYYPAKQKLVYIMLGHAYVFEDPDTMQEYFDERVIKSFSLR